MPLQSCPPRIFRSLIRACLPNEDRAAMLGDLDELYELRVRRTGRFTAQAWYARQAFGFLSRVATARAAEGIGGFGSYKSDAQLVLRYFRRRLSFALAVVMTLGIGTGAVITVYSAAEWLLLRPVPGVFGEDALMTLRLGVNAAPPHVSWDISHQDLVTLRERLPARMSLAARRPIDFDLRASGGAARRVAGEIVTSNYFEVLGHSLFAGRTFSRNEEHLHAGAAVAVVSHSLARSLYADVRAAVGADIRLNGSVVRVVGVAAEGFRGAELPSHADVWMPLGSLALIEPSGRTAPNPGATAVWRRIIIRAAGASAVDTAAAANEILAPAAPFTVLVTPGVGLDPGVRASVKGTLSVVGGAALFLLTLAIANLVNLGLMESTIRARVTAVRIALGATPARMVRTLLVEVVLLGTGGAVVALGLSGIWSWWFQGTQLSEFGGSLQGMHVNAVVVTVSLLVATAAAFVALMNTAVLRRFCSLEASLRGNSRASAPQRLHMTLVGAQVALTLLLVVVSGLLAGSVRNLRRIDLGFSPDGLLVFSMAPNLHGFESDRLDRLGRELESSLLDQPGIRAAGFVSPSPLRSGYFSASFGAHDKVGTEAVTGAGYYVTPGFLRALGARVVAGDRAWNAQPSTVVVSRTAIAKLFPGVRPDDVIGRHLSGRRRHFLQWQIPTGAPPEGETHRRYSRTDGPEVLRIAAVIDDLRLSDIVTDPPPTFFRPLSEAPAGLSVSGFAATAQRPTSAAPIIGGVLQERVPDLPVFDVRTAREAVDLQFAELKAMALVTNTLGAIGVLLSAVGLYGVLANAVTSRRREIGVRVALGAAPRRLLWEVLLRGAVPVVAGVFVGALLAAGGSQLLAQHLFGVAPLEPAVYGGGMTLIAFITTAACVVPAYRATRISPASVLRAE